MVNDELPQWLADGKKLMDTHGGGARTLTAWDEWWKRHGTSTLLLALKGWQADQPSPCLGTEPHVAIDYMGLVDDASADSEHRLGSGWYDRVPVDCRFTADLDGGIVQDQDGPWVLRSEVDKALAAVSPPRQGPSVPAPSWDAFSALSRRYGEMFTLARSCLAAAWEVLEVARDRLTAEEIEESEFRLKALDKRVYGPGRPIPPHATGPASFTGEGHSPCHSVKEPKP